MLKIDKDHVKGFKELDVPYTLLSTGEESKSLAIMLPGAGYTAQSPLFHYSTEVFLSRSFDVLEVNYRYNDEVYSGFNAEELSEAVQSDAKTVIDHVLETHSYENFYLIGKSIGSIALISELKRAAFKVAKAVWLTPLLQRNDVFMAMAKSPHTALCFIGDQDPCYIEERLKQLENNPNITFELLPGADHSLELKDDAVGSIDVLKSIISDIEKF